MGPGVSAWSGQLTGVSGPGPTEGLGSSEMWGLPVRGATKERAVWSAFLQP